MYRKASLAAREIDSWLYIYLKLVISPAMPIIHN